MPDVFETVAAVSAQNKKDREDAWNIGFAPFIGGLHQHITKTSEERKLNQDMQDLYKQEGYDLNLDLNVDPQLNKIKAGIDVEKQSKMRGYIATAQTEGFPLPSGFDKMTPEAQTVTFNKLQRENTDIKKLKETVSPEIVDKVLTNKDLTHEQKIQVATQLQAVENRIKAEELQWQYDKKKMDYAKSISGDGKIGGLTVGQFSNMIEKHDAAQATVTNSRNFIKDLVASGFTKKSDGSLLYHQHGKTYEIKGGEIYINGKKKDINKEDYAKIVKAMYTKRDQWIKAMADGRKAYSQATTLRNMIPGYDNITPPDNNAPTPAKQDKNQSVQSIKDSTLTPEQELLRKKHNYGGTS